MARLVHTIHAHRRRNVSMAGWSPPLAVRKAGSATKNWKMTTPAAKIIAAK
jgi:hypothetical protein